MTCLRRNGCATSEDMLWKLEALQTFVFDLHWPDEVFGEHISSRLRTLSTEMIEAAANRFLARRSVMLLLTNLLAFALNVRSTAASWVKKVDHRQGRKLQFSHRCCSRFKFCCQSSLKCGFQLQTWNFLAKI